MIPQEADTIAVLEDVSSSEAFKVLDALVDIGSLQQDRADDAGTKFSQLHSSLVATMMREKYLLEHAKELQRALEVEEERVAAAERTAQEFEGLDVDVLKEDVEAAMSEAALAAERQQLAQLEVSQLQRQQQELAQHIEELQDEQSNALRPVIQQLETEVAILRRDHAAEKSRAEATAAEVAEARQQLERAQRELKVMQTEHEEQIAGLARASGLPEAARRQADLVVPVITGLQKAMEALAAELSSYESRKKSLDDKAAELEGEHAREVSAAERCRIIADTKERHEDDLLRDIELAGVDADRILADQAESDLKLRDAAAALRHEQALLARQVREKDLALRAYRNAEVELDKAREELPPLTMSRALVCKEIDDVQKAAARQSVEVAHVKGEVQRKMDELLQEETLGKDKVAMFNASRAEAALLEREVIELKGEDRELQQLLRDLSAQRDRAAQQLALRTRKLREAEHSCRIRQLELNDLKNVRKDVLKRVSDFEKLYSLVKNQRNKFVNLIQAANQGMLEMRDKLKVLQNELEILRNEAAVKAKLLGRAKSQHTTSVVERDHLRADMHKQNAALRSKQQLLDEQLTGIDHLSTIINSAERQMLAMRKRYEAAVESRNCMGLSLIDRNDELCVLYERVGLQDEVLKNGTLEVHKQENQIRILKIEILELERSALATRKMVPQIPLVDQDIARLQAALYEARSEAQRLSLELEDPTNTGRARMLSGKVPERDELVARVQHLEERLADKRDALMERNIVLEGVESVTERLRAQASAGRSGTLELAQSANQYQQRLRNITRRIMATISELSMYQATALKLASERDALGQEVQAARARLEDGQPPTQDAAAEWARILREASTLGDLAARRLELERLLDDRSATVHTTAETRPNAYIPESLGIPKPYGEFTPFKPTELGSTMRHIRKPQPREIVI